jgi:O-antigen/teichoic acid export membrane protein
MRLRPTLNEATSIYGLTMLRVGIGGIGTLVVPALLVRQYGLLGLGEWAVVQAVSAVVGFLELGLTSSLARTPIRENLDPHGNLEQWRSCFTYVVIVCSAVILTGGLLAAREHSYGILGPSIVVGTANTIAMLACVPPNAWLLGSGAARKSYSVNAQATVLRTVGILGPLLLHMSPWFMGVGAALATIYQVLRMYRASLLLGIRRAYFGLSLRFRPARAHLLFGLNASASTANELATNYVDKIILGSFCPISYVGIFQGVSAATSGIFSVGMTLQGYIFSWFVAERHDGHRPNNAEAARAIRLFSLLIVCLPYVVSLWLYARSASILGWWLHIHSRAAVWSMQLVLLAVLINLAYVPVVQRLLAAGDARIVGRAAGASAIVNLTLSICLVFSLSLVGVSLASLVAVCAAVGVFLAEPLARSCVKASAPGLFIALSVAPVGFLLQHIFDRPGVKTDLLILTALCGLAACTLLAARQRIRVAVRWLERPPPKRIP